MRIVVYKGLDPRYPAASCAEILSNQLNAPSGYYWLRSGNGSAVRVFCDKTITCKGVGEGWMHVAKLDMTNSSYQKFMKVFSLESFPLYGSLSKNNTMVNLNLAIQYRIAITNRPTRMRNTSRF